MRYMKYFEKYSQPNDMWISEFINQFEQFLSKKKKKNGSNMSSDILAYHLLKAGNLSEYHEQ